MPRQNIVILLVGIFVCLVCAGRTSLEEQVLHYILGKIEREALEPVDRERLLEGAMNGMVSESADYPYSAYLGPEEEAEYEDEIQGRTAGIGIYRMQQDEPSGEIWFTPVYDSPAADAGLRFGDRIAAADGKSFQGLSIREIGKLLRGDEGTSVRLTVRPREEILASSETSAPEEKEKIEEKTDAAPSATREVEITRRLFQVDIIAGDRRDADGKWIYTLADHPKIGYIRVDQFTETTGDEFSVALETLSDAESLILDLRGNPGGFLPAAIMICDHFLPDGSEIVTTRRRDGSVKGRFCAGGGKKRLDLRLAVLIDDGSASASEIVSSAMQDHQRGTIIGSRSYGKGTVQELFPLPCGLGLLRLTDASFWGPSGKPIHRHHGAKEDEAWGVKPDDGFAVPMTYLESDIAGLYRDIRSLPNDTPDAAVTEKIIDQRLRTMKKEDYLDDSSEEEIDNETADTPADSAEPDEQSKETPSAESAENIDESKDEKSAPKRVGSAPYFDPPLERAIQFLTEQNDKTERTE